MPKFSVILAAAGSSNRFRDDNYKKPFINLKKKAVWLHSADRFMKRDEVKQVIIVIAKDDQESFMARFGANLAVLGIDVALGGKERSDSIACGLKKVEDGTDFVAIHDAARPCVTDEDIDRVFEAATKMRAAILATPVTATLKKSTDGKTISGTQDRSQLWMAQTPQVFARDLIVDAYQNIGDFKPTDDAQLVEHAGHPVAIVKGSSLNIKITTKMDLRLAGACLDAMPPPRFDAPPHPFADDNLWR